MPKSQESAHLNINKSTTAEHTLPVKMKKKKKKE